MHWMGWQKVTKSKEGRGIGNSDSQWEKHYSSHKAEGNHGLVAWLAFMSILIL